MDYAAGAGAAPSVSGKVNFLFLATLFVHLIDVIWGRYSGNSSTGLILLLIVFYLLIAIYAINALNLPIKTGVFTVSIISALAIFFPQIVTNLSGLLKLNPQLVGSILIFAPIWPIYLILFHIERFSGFFKKLGQGYLIFWVVFFLISFLPAIQARISALGTQDVSPVQPWTAAKYIYDTAKSNVLKFSNQTKTAYEQQKKQFEFITGDPFTSEVDKKAKIKLGVFFENVQPTSPRYLENRPVEVVGTVRSTTFDQTIPITFSCTAEGIKEGIVVSEPTFTLIGSDSRGVFCRVPSGFTTRAATEYKTITMTIDFQFNSVAYANFFFMDAGLKRSLRKTDTDILSDYGIESKRVTTQGPLDVKWSIFGSTVTGVELGRENRFDFGLQLLKRPEWEGSVRAIKQLVVITPSEFEVADAGTYDIKKSSCAEIGKPTGCDDSLQNIYSVKIPEYEDGMVVAFHTKISPAKQENLLRSTIEQRFFKAIVDYDFKLEKKQTITVVKSREKIIT